MEQVVDVDHDEFGERLARVEKLVGDTNRQVHAMRRNQRVHSFLSVLWWLIVLGVSAYSYYTYVQPYVDRVMSAYGSEQNLQHQVQGYFSQYFGTSTRQ